MAFFLMWSGIFAALSVTSENPAHVNYSRGFIAAVCFIAAALIEIFSRT